MSDNVTIAEAIKQLRTQLIDAQLAGKDAALQFWAKSVEVELSVVYKTAVEGGGGVKAWFLDLSARASRGEESGHKVKLVLEPLLGADGKVLVSGAAAPADTEIHR